VGSNPAIPTIFRLAACNEFATARIEARDAWCNSPMDAFEEFKLQMHQKYPEVFRAAFELPGHANTIFAWSPAEPLHKVMRLMAKVVVNDFGAVTMLALYGYGVAAAKITRSMFELAINAAYLRENPDLIDDYIDFYHVTKHQFYEDMVQCSGLGVTELSEESIAEMKADYERVRARFPGERSWTRKNLFHRAQAVGLDKLYLMFYPIASGIIHGDIRGLSAHSTEESYDVDPAPAQKWIHEVLVLSHNAVVRVMHDYNAVAEVKCDREVEAITKGFKRAWPSD
jgi:hypothetical protein